MKKILSVLQKTTRHAGVGLIVFGLIVIAAPVAVFATVNNNDDTPIVQEHKIDICHFEGNGNAQILNIDENGWNGHQNHDGDFIINDQDENTSNDSEDCVSKLPPPIVDVCLNLSEIQTVVPEGYTVNSDHICTLIKQEASCIFGSDTTTVVGTSPAVASFVHAAWTHALESTGIMWIWNAAFATPSDTVDEVVTFTKTFNVVGTPSSVKLDLAADNYYTVAVNGTSACTNGTDLDNFSSVEPQCDIMPLVHTGVNTLTFVVTNAKGYGTNPETNPGGLIYKVTIDGTTCAPVPPPVRNSCVAPVPTEGPAHVTIGANPNEPTLQSILTAVPYTLNVDTDQLNAQSWSGTNNTVHFSVKAISKNAGHSHVFGYKVNGGAFVGVFRDGEVTNPIYSGLPLKKLPADGSVSFDVVGVSDVVLGIYNDNTSTYFYTKKSSNGDSLDHAVVYNPTSNEYVIGFEDLTGGGDSDMNDLVVSVTVTGCEDASTTATIHAQKVVCTNEADLPNWGAGAADITATTATDWVAEHKSCSLVPWDFQWAPSDTSNPGDNTVGLPAGWSAFVSGVASIPAGARAWVRENINTDYIPFTGPNAENNVSAEMYCSNDVLNYDNFDYIDPVVAGTHYYCVGFNVLKVPEVPPAVCSDKLDNDGDQLIDTADPGCHSDGNASNSVSYTPNGDSEVNDMCSNIGGTQTTVPVGMTVNDGLCTTPVVETPTVTTPTTTGGGRSGGRSGGGGGGRVQGQVLGASCGLYMEKHLRLGSKKNDVEQTKKLQTFLNKWMKSSLPISGVYGPATEKVVKSFQNQYAGDILTPWKIGAPTGLVYYTTLHKINELECPEAAGDKPKNLIDWSKNKNAQ